MDKDRMKRLRSNSRLTVAELAMLFGVNRVTASRWLNGHTSPHPLHSGRIEWIVERIEEAIADGSLPLAEPVRSAVQKRVSKLETIFPDLV